jgi:outer membrane protein TolC
MNGVRIGLVGALIVVVFGCKSPAARPPQDDFETQLKSTKTSAQTATATAPPKPASVEAVSFQPPAEVLPPPTPNIFPPVPFDSTLPPEAHRLGGATTPADINPLTLREVTQSVYFSFPGLEIAIREGDIAAGKELSTYGEFDLKLKAESFSEPQGFYKYYTNVAKIEQALWQGGELFARYRNGSGKFPVWYGGLETTDGGEFAVGAMQPLLRNRAIDERRANVMLATLRRQQVEPAVEALILQVVQAAADAYWSWVAAGQAYDVQRELLRVTIERNKAYEARVAAGDLPRLELVQNERLIASREAKVVEADRKLQQAAIKLSLYLRDDAGQPLLPSPALLPNALPEPEQPPVDNTAESITQAIQSRPELRELAFIRRQAEIDLSFGQNYTLPALDAALKASQDVGGTEKKINDKLPFELEAGLFFDLPVQRRKAFGKIREAEGKLAQIAAKWQLTENKIVIEVQDAYSALITSYHRWQRARENTKLAMQLVVAERQRFEAQDSDLLRVAIQEAAAMEAELTEVEALADFHKAEAARRAATAQPPLAPNANPIINPDNR